MTVGAKRNTLVSKASGDTIIRMDDDDYYAPGYIEGMLTLMANNKADIVKLFGVFLYHQRSGCFGYWDLEVAFPVQSDGRLPNQDRRREDIARSGEHEVAPALKRSLKPPTLKERLFTARAD